MTGNAQTTAPGAPVPRLNEKVRELAAALGLTAGARDTFQRLGTTLRWPLLDDRGVRYELELWVGYARCIPNVEGQMAMVTVSDGATGLQLRQACLLSPDHEKLNRQQALCEGRRRLVAWLEDLASLVSRGEPLVKRRPAGVVRTA